MVEISCYTEMTCIQHVQEQTNISHCLHAILVTQNKQDYHFQHALFPSQLDWPGASFFTGLVTGLANPGPCPISTLGVDPDSSWIFFFSLANIVITHLQIKVQINICRFEICMLNNDPIAWSSSVEGINIKMAQSIIIWVIVFLACVLKNHSVLYCMLIVEFLW